MGKLFRASTLEEVLLYCDSYSPGKPPTVFYDRNSSGFNTVLDIYRTGKLHFTEKSCALGENVTHTKVGEGGGDVNMSTMTGNDCCNVFFT